MKRIFNILICIMVFSSLCLFAANDKFKTSDSGFKDLWEKEFMFKPVIKLSDRRAQVETWLLGGYEHNSSMLNVLLTNLILTSFDNKYVITSEIPQYFFLKEAEILKHAELTVEEVKAVKSLYAKCARKHPHGRTLNNAFLPVFLEKTIGNAQSMDMALAEIDRINGTVCDYGVSNHPKEEMILQLLSEGNPVILEKKGKHNLNPFSNDDGRWRMVFGAYSDIQGELQLLVNIPEETTLMERWSWPFTWLDALESIKINVIYEYNHDRKIDTGYYNIRSNIDNMICNNGFISMPASRLTDYRLHAIRNWRRSAAAQDDELRKILDLPKAEPQEKLQKPGDHASSRDLWKYYFSEHAGEAGLAYDGGCIRHFRLPEGTFSPLEKALFASVSMHNEDMSTSDGIKRCNPKYPFAAFGLSFPGRLFHTSRLFLGNTLLMPTQAELDKCIELARSEREQYVASYGELPPEKYTIDDDEYANDSLAQRTPGYKSRHSLSAHLFHSLPKILEGVTSVREAIDRMGPACAWTATVEGGSGTDWETMKLAIWRQIPVILEGKGGDWRVAVAYLGHGGKKLLLVTKRQDANAAPAEPVLKEYDLPGELPEELEFMEYDEAQWTPWFVHHFEPTVEHLAPQILEIFKDHPEAKAMMQGEGVR